jgi:hypothetical protein
MDRFAVAGWFQMLEYVRLKRAHNGSNPKSYNCRDCDGRQEVPAELIIARGDPPKVLEAAEGVLDEVPISISRLVIGDLPLAVGPAGNDRPRPLFAQGFAKGICIVALISDEMLRAPQSVRKQFGGPNVANVAGSEPEREWSSDHVGEDVDLAGLTAPRGADALRFRPPLPPKAERCAFTYVLSMEVLVVTAPAAAKASSIPVQNRLRDQRLKRL